MNVAGEVNEPCATVSVLQVKDYTQTESQGQCLVTLHPIVLHDRQGYTCPVLGCLTHSNTLSQWKDHATKHTGDRPFQCDQCSKRFKQSAHLRTHIRSLHTSWFWIDETPYTCPHENCSKAFHQLANMQKHYSNHHNVQSSANHRRANRRKQLKLRSDSKAYDKHVLDLSLYTDTNAQKGTVHTPVMYDHITHPVPASNNVCINQSVEESYIVPVLLSPIQSTHQSAISNNEHTTNHHRALPECAPVSDNHNADAVRLLDLSVTDQSECLYDAAPNHNLSLSAWSFANDCHLDQELFDRTPSTSAIGFRELDGRVSSAMDRQLCTPLVTPYKAQSIGTARTPLVTPYKAQNIGVARTPLVTPYKAQNIGVARTPLVTPYKAQNIGAVLVTPSRL